MAVFLNHNFLIPVTKTVADRAKVTINRALKSREISREICENTGIFAHICTSVAYLV